jgi:hypothetical protein
MRRRLVLAAAAVLTGGLLVSGPPAAGAAACRVSWGSQAKAGSAFSASPLVGVRAGRNTCFDRLVLEVAGPARAVHDVRYVPAVVQDGSGRRVPLRGAAGLRVVVRVPAYDGAGRSTYRPADRAELADVSGFRTFRQVAWAGSFEGYTTVGLGARARLPFRVLVLPGPGSRSRVVVDIAHQW